MLLRVSNLLLKFLRNVDIVGRWGGEEFVALLPIANLENAVILANKIRKGIQSEQILEDRVVTASFGVTQIIIGDELIDAIRRADDALYEAKKDGKNIVKTA
ncbi:MAG: GGDEF domain-containing protein [Campylobacterales bacterium]|nr:GGDEF domain-containing protein [Campylobacterales bacterium]